jgi:hypothetical protein
MSDDLNTLMDLMKLKISEYGHITKKWVTFGGRKGYGLDAHANDYCGYTECALCKEKFSIDVSKKETEIVFNHGQCTMNPNGYLKETNADGVAITTWDNCYLCGKKLSSPKAMLRGTCSETGCNNMDKVKIGKDNKFYSLSKLPKENAKTKWPIFNYPLVIIHDNKMICKMPQWKDDLIEYAVVVIENVRGNLNLGLPRNSFVDLMQLINTDDCEILQDNEKCIVISGNSKTILNGLPAEEYPLDKSNSPAT